MEETLFWKGVGDDNEQDSIAVVAHLWKVASMLYLHPEVRVEQHSNLHKRSPNLITIEYILRFILLDVRLSAEFYYNKCKNCNEK